jgi:hypothetical protein
MSMTDDTKARTRQKIDDTRSSDERSQEDSGQENEARKDNGEAHTELVPAGQGPRPRARVLPSEVSDDDLFNDMPV